MSCKLIDTHAHLEEVEDLAGALIRAKEAGVETIVAVGQNAESNEQVLKIAEEYREPRICVALGIHPSGLESERAFSALDFIKKRIEKTIAIGEIGLDYWYKEARKEGRGRELQQEIFRKQLDLAVEYDKPVSIHSRGAWKDCFRITLRQKTVKAVFHWYSGPEDVLKEILESGYFISATPAAEYSSEHRAAIAKTPIERLLLETDSPVTYKPETGTYRSEPKDVMRSLKAVAEIKGIDESYLAQKTTENAMRFFGLERE